MMARATRSRPPNQRPARHGHDSTQSGAGWAIRRARGLQIVESRALARLSWLVHAFSTRLGGESMLAGKRVLNLGFTDWDERTRVQSNRDKFMAALGAKQMPLVVLRQIHSDVLHV